MSEPDANPTHVGGDGNPVPLAAFLGGLWRSELVGPEQEEEILARSAASQDSLLTPMTSVTR